MVGALVLAAEEAEKSETPFFVAGALLVIFAVGVSVIGFRRPDFPTTTTAARGVMAMAVLLVLGAMSAAVYVAS
ncbi:MAG: hypothetical protein M3296_10355 [Actinomycetota bacterium]|nr:hypothetical protein [Actinomycetota bacterium]